jgi:hypothetical protein
MLHRGQTPDNILFNQSMMLPGKWARFAGNIVETLNLALAAP